MNRNRFAVALLACLLAAAPAVAGEPVVAKVKVQNPSAAPMKGVVMCGMLPVPRDYEKDVKALALRDGDNVLPTQVTVFATYPGSDKDFPVGRPEVVQLAAKVDLPAKAFKEFEVVELDVVPEAAPAAAPGDRLGPLAGDPPKIMVEVTGCFGKQYSAPVLRPVRLSETRGSGPLLVEQVYAPLLIRGSLVRPGRPPLRRPLRVRAYLTQYAGEDFASLALMIHNGSIDNPNGDVYYRSIRVGIRKPLVAKVWHKRFSPAAEGGWTEDKDYRWLTCPPALKDGKLFVMPHGSAAVLRMTLYAPGAKQRAMQFHEFAPVFVPVPSQELWSWSNFKTARYDSPKYPMPLSLDIARLDRHVKGRLASPSLGWDLTYLWQKPKPPYRTMGHAMPAGVAYGGMTGGQGVNFVFGAAAAVTGHQGAIKLHVLLADRNFDRQRVHFFHSDGKPFTYGRRVVEVGGKKMLDIPYNHRGFHVPAIKDPAAKVQADHVAKNDLLSDQAKRLLRYHNHDDQHLSRVFDAVPAAYLACDPVNRDRLVTLGAQACWKLNIYPVKRMPRFGGWGSLFGAKKHVDAKPHQGIGAGRELGWKLHSLCWAHALSLDAQIRKDCVSVGKVAVEVAEKAQTSVGNVTMRGPSGKAFKGAYWFTTGWEEGAIIPDGMRAVMKMLESREDQAVAERLKVVYGKVGKWIMDKAWNKAINSPGFHIALMEKGKKTPMPMPMSSGHGCGFYLGTPTVWYYELTGDKVFLDRLKAMSGGKGLAARSKATLGNWSYALWLAQGGKIPGREPLKKEE